MNSKISTDLIEVPKDLIERCFQFVDGYFQMDPSGTKNELWRDLNHEITRPRINSCVEPESLEIAVEDYETTIGIEKSPQYWTSKTKLMLTTSGFSETQVKEHLQISEPVAYWLHRKSDGVDFGVFKAEEAKDENPEIFNFTPLYEKQQTSYKITNCVVSWAGVAEVVSSGTVFECVMLFNTYEDAVDALHFMRYHSSNYSNKENKV